MRSAPTDAVASAETTLRPYSAWLRTDFADVAAALAVYAALLTKWNATHNLVSRETITEIWTRHIADSLQLLPLISDTDRSIVDLGSGGGLPAIPLAIASTGTPRAFNLFEPVGKKASFLRTVARETGLDVTVIAERVTPTSTHDIASLITSRALTSLTQLLPLMQPFSSPYTRALIHKGRDYRRELAEAAQHHQFDVLVHPSSVDPEGVVLELTRFG